MAFKPTPEMEEALRKVLEQFNTDSEDYDEDNFLDRLVDYENDFMPDDIREAYTGGMPSQDLLDWEKFVYKDTPWKDVLNGEAHDPDGSAGNPVTSETVIDKDDDGDVDVTIIEQEDGDDNYPIVKGVPGYDGTRVDAGALSGMLTDSPETIKAARKWIDANREKLQPLLDSQTFKDMYGDYDKDNYDDWFDGDKKPESDKPHDEGLAGETTLEEDLMLNPDMSPSEFSKKAAEKRGAKPGEPAPDFNNFTNDIARNLASRRW